MSSSLFRVLIACLVAVPFGPGGVCCCLLAAPAARPAASAPASSCCHDESSPSAPASEGERAPTDPARDDCSCPARDAFLFEGAGPRDAGLPLAAGIFAAIPLPGMQPALLPAAASRHLHRIPHPPPKLALHRTLCIDLC